MTETRKIIRGDWMDNGFIRDLVVRKLDVVIIDGRAYDGDWYATPCGCPLSDMRLTIDAYGTISAVGAAWEFSPDEGEIERIGGRKLFICAADKAA